MASKYFCVGVFDISTGPASGPIHGMSANGILGASHYAAKILNFSSANVADKVTMAADVVAKINAATVSAEALAAGVTSIRAVHSPDSTVIAVAMWTTINLTGKMQLLSGPTSTPFDVHLGITGVTAALPATTENPQHTYDLLSGIIGLGVGALVSRN